MKVLETCIYRGPNLYALWPVIRLRLDLGELEWFPTTKLPGFSDQLVELIPTLAEHTCSYGVPGGFVRRLNEGDGTWLGHVMEHVAIELQCLAGTPVTFGKTRGSGLPPGQYHVVYTYGDEHVGLAAGHLALRLIHHLLPARLEAHDPAPLDLQAELESLKRLAQDRALDPATAALVKAAEERGIPWIRLDDKSLVALGHGRFQRRIQGGLTSETSHLAVEIASDKPLTQRILGRIGLPVPRQVEGADGVTESFEPGRDYRLLVVGGKVVAATDGDAADQAVDRMDVLHEDNRIMAERAAAALGLAVAGIGFVSPDISLSYRDVGGAIVGVDAAPRDVAGPVIDGLFPPDASPCCPLAAVAGARGKTTTTRMVGHILGLAGHTVGMATSEGVYVDGSLIVGGDMTGPEASELVLRNPSVDAAVLETAHGGIARSGLGWRQCNVGAVLNVVASDPWRQVETQSLDPLAQVTRVVVEVAKDYCVLNADDPRVAAMAEHSPGEPLWVTQDPRNELVRRHIRGGGRAVALEPRLNGRLLVLYEGEKQVSLLWARQIPATEGGKVTHNIQNAMFAAAIAFGLGVDAELIRKGLRTFETKPHTAERLSNVLPQRRAVG
ncbi:MAG: Mur ligase family protein [Thermoanaerobaculia bacterium]